MMIPEQIDMINQGLKVASRTCGVLYMPEFETKSTYGQAKIAESFLGGLMDVRFQVTEGNLNFTIKLTKNTVEGEFVDTKYTSIVKLELANEDYWTKVGGVLKHYQDLM